ncbi:NADPH:quinone reductase [Pseudomonas fluorescens]|uniref:NADPH:quinone reductase n=1 Tax=Pseudomonas fluorescens TaxID=294 RepID=UPI00177C5610|nr:NADPH:quinone reductase [Pseudomonas fluorescens]MBD8235845.1 NADPH:quinone reductase [Pseudomonas fluorescens]MDY0894939.1 NADPH:quinone reductase [Pseudomonas fluorescens]
MKAAWYENVGLADEVLVVGHMATPEPSAGEVLIRLYASGVNPSDVKARAGKRAGGSGMPFPRVIPHSDGAGIIEAVGAGVPERRIGTRVWIWNAQWGRAFGSAAEYVALPANQAIPLGESVSFETGACLGIPAVTAAHCVMGDGPVKGKTVMVSGGAGTVGRLAVQIAHLNGARVIATAMNPEDMERAIAAGADVAINFTSDNVTEQILAANNGNPVDRIVEVEFGVNAEINAAVITERGSVVTYGSALSMRPELPFYSFLFKGVNLEFVLVYLLNEKERQLAADHVNAALTNGLSIPLHATYPLEECAKAHNAVEGTGRIGSVVVVID